MDTTTTTDYSRLESPRHSAAAAGGDKPDFVDAIVAWFVFYLRPIVKGFLRLTTRLCELQRICYGEPKGGPRSMAVESSLRQSRSRAVSDAMSELRAKMERCGGSAAGGDGGRVDVVDALAAEKAAVDAAVGVVLEVKKIKKNLHQQFIYSLRFCLCQIYGYEQLVAEVERVRSIGYDSENLEHERCLLQLWDLLQPGVPLLKRKTKEWQSLGFQGEDPKTDFRGMGMLGLHNLLYFAREYNTAAKYILSHSHHPKHGYSFAIVGINITDMAYRFLSQGLAKSHFFNIAADSLHAAADAATAAASSDGSVVGIGGGANLPGKPTVENFHHFYCYLFVEFDKFWLEMKPSSMMSFSYVRDLFETRVRNELADPKTCFKVNVAVDTV